MTKRTDQGFIRAARDARRHAHAWAAPLRAGPVPAPVDHAPDIRPSLRPARAAHPAGGARGAPTGPRGPEPSEPVASPLRSANARTRTRNGHGAETSIEAREVDPGRSEPGILGEPDPERVVTEAAGVGLLLGTIEPVGGGFQRGITPSPRSSLDEMRLPGDRPNRVIDGRYLHERFPWVPYARLLPLEAARLRERPAPERSRRVIGTPVGAPSPPPDRGRLLAGRVQGLAGEVVRSPGDPLTALALGRIAPSCFRGPEPGGRVRVDTNRPGGTLPGPPLEVPPAVVSRGDRTTRTSSRFPGVVTPVVPFVRRVPADRWPGSPWDVTSAAVASRWAAGLALNAVMLGGQRIVAMYPSTSKEVAGYVFGLGVMANLPCDDRIDAPGPAEPGRIASVVTRFDYGRTVFFAFLDLVSTAVRTPVPVALPGPPPGFRFLGDRSGVGAGASGQGTSVGAAPGGSTPFTVASPTVPAGSVASSARRRASKAEVVGGSGIRVEATKDR